MADRVSVILSLGGLLRRNLLPELVAAIELEGASLDWEGAPFSVDDLPKAGPLTVMACEVAWGSFNEIEWFCRCHGLSYVRWSGGCAGSFGPERVVYRGSGEPDSYLVTEGDTLVFDLDEIRRLGSIEAIEAHAATAAFHPPALTIVDPVPAEGSQEEVRHG